MKTPPPEEESRTIETRLSHPHLYPLLDELLSYFSSLRHRLWRDLIIKALPTNELSVCPEMPV